MNKDLIEQESVEQVELVVFDKIDQLKSRLDQLIDKLTKSGSFSKFMKTDSSD